MYLIDVEWLVPPFLDIGTPESLARAGAFMAEVRAAAPSDAGRHGAPLTVNLLE